MTVTRADVARRARVSPAVVSYVVNGGPRGVAPATRARVEAAIEELGYRPNAVAQALRNSATRTIGLVLPNQTNQYFAELTEEIERAAFEAGYLLLVGITHDDLERERRYVEMFVDRRVDGLLLVSGRAGELIARDSPGTPTVAVDREARIPGASTVKVDNALGAAQATGHLLAHGLSLVACVAGPRGISLSAEREDTWRRACADLGYSHRLPGSPSRPTPPAGLALHPHLPEWLGPGRTRPQRQARRPGWRLRRRRPRTSFRLRVRGLTAEHEGCGLAFESEPSYSAQSPRTRRRHSRRRTTEVSTGRSAGVGRQVPGRDAAAEPCAIADPRRPVAS